MSQQMFEPQESQENQQPDWWIYDRPRRDRKTREMPKNEHPSTFEEPFATIDAASYSAQSPIDGDADEKSDYRAGYIGYTNDTSSAGGDTERRHYSPDGESMEYGYRPYNAYQPSQTATATSASVPPWARPQRNPVFRILAKVLVILLIAALVLKIIIPLLVVLFAVVAVFVLIAAVGLLVFGIFILGILRLLGVRVPLRPTRLLRRRGRGRHIYFHL